MVGYSDLITRNEIGTTLAKVTYLRTCIGCKTVQKFFVFLLLWFSSRVNEVISRLHTLQKREPSSLV